MLTFARALRWLVPIGLFVSIGWRLQLARYWVFLAIMVAWVIYVSRSVDPTLFRERFKPAGPTVDRYALGAIRASAAAALALTLVDIGRFHWSDTVPPAARLAAMGALIGSLMLLGRSMIANRFFSTAIRLQSDRGHRVVDAGPYAVVRHPGYLAMAILTPAIALALGSWFGALLALVYSAMILRRVAVEDRFLRAELDGYAEYAARVRFRLIPGVW
jgi:protein-S-isoprenylcysteine O-methyltransferase Ste14